jgi:hypothetical protein
MEVLTDVGTVRLFNVSTIADGVLRVWFGTGDRDAAAELATLLIGVAVTLVLVERVVVNVVAGSVEIAFHDLGGPFDAEPGTEHGSGASATAPAGPDEPGPDDAPFPWLAGRAAPTVAQEARP